MKDKLIARVRAAVAKDAHWLALEVAGGYSIFWGMWHYSHAVAGIVAGLGAMLVSEIRSGSPGGT